MPDHVTVTESSVTIVRTLEAPPESVFSAWTDPAKFARWFGTPPYLTDPASVSMELRVGGLWRATMVSADDGSEMPFAGHYVAVDPPERLVLTFEDPAKLGGDHDTLTVTLRDLGDGSTQMVARQEGGLPPEQYPLLGEGYSRFFDRMAEVLASE